MELSLNQALKEWAVVVDALTEGKTILLLRKGGIEEGKSGFTVKYKEVLLYPTYEHQKPELLKPEYAALRMSEEDKTITFKSWAKITDSFLIAYKPAIDRLFPYHVWNEDFINKRLEWKPGEPINVLLLKVFKNRQPVTIDYDQVYGSCKSWIEIKQNITVDEERPVLTDGEYNHQANLIRQALSEAG